MIYSDFDLFLNILPFTAIVIIFMFLYIDEIDEFFSDGFKYPKISGRVIHIKEESSIIKTFTEHGLIVSDALLIQKYFENHYKRNCFNDCKVLLTKRERFTSKLMYMFYFLDKNEILVITIKHNNIESTHKKLELHKVVLSKTISSDLPPTVLDQLTALKNGIFADISKKAWNSSSIYWEAYFDTNNINIKHGKIIKIGFTNQYQSDPEFIFV